MHGYGSYPLIDVRDSSVATQRTGPRWIGRYVEPERKAWSVATQRLIEWLGRSLYSNGLVRGSVATQRLVRGLVATWRPCLDPFLAFYERVLGLWVFRFDESTKISGRFHRKVLRKDFITNITFRKTVHAVFYGYLDVNFALSVFDPNRLSYIDSVVTDFDPNSQPPSLLEP